MKFKTRMISTAVVAALGTIAGTAQAVNLGADGQGQVLIYPYYTVQQKGTTAYDTYISIVNSDTVRGKAVKVRVLEGKNSREVLDFNLYLSPNDVWTAALTRNSAGNGILRTSDNSCTAPEIPVVSGVTREVAFVNFAYDGANDDAAENTLDRAREGYVEIIQMADLVSGVKTDGLQSGSSVLDTFAASKHNSAGVPPNCAAIRTAWTSGDYASPANDGVSAPTGSLGGAGMIINPLEGTDIGYPAVALDNFRNVADHRDPGNVLPNLAGSTPQISDVFDGARLVRTNWTADVLAGTVSAAAPVSATIMRDQVQNEYAAASAPTGLSTDWVVTFPTKAQHLANTANRQPFTQAFATTGSCDTVTVTAYNREEGEQTTGLIFSPPPPAGVNKLCWEVNVLRLNGPGGTPASNALGSLTVGQGLNLPFTEGWLRLAFSNTMVSAAGTSSAFPLGGAVTAMANPVTYNGLPVIGFMANTFQNTSSLSAFGEAFPHRYTRRITP